MKTEVMAKYHEFPDLNLLLKQLNELYMVESGLVMLLEKMKDDITNEKIEEVFDEHLRETKRHVEELVAIFEKSVA